MVAGVSRSRQASPPKPTRTYVIEALSIAQLPEMTAAEESALAERLHGFIVRVLDAAGITDREGVQVELVRQTGRVRGVRLRVARARR
jgi:hypothetical protein